MNNKKSKTNLNRDFLEDDRTEALITGITGWISLSLGASESLCTIIEAVPATCSSLRGVISKITPTVPFTLLPSFTA